MNGVQEEKFNLEICHFIRQAVYMLKSHHRFLDTKEKIADALKISFERLNNIMDGTTPPSYGLFLSIQKLLKDEDKDYSYNYLKKQLFPEF